MYSARDLHKGGVSPFGHPRINDRSHLPAAFRSVPRPSSPLGAKASTERPSHTHSPPPARRIQPRHHWRPKPLRVQSDSSSTETLTPHGLSAVWPNTRFHQLFFTMRNNNRKPRCPKGPSRRFSGSPATRHAASGSDTLTWRRSDSNRRPPACKAGALPTELRPQRRTPGPTGPTRRRPSRRSAYGPGRT